MTKHLLPRLITTRPAAFAAYHFVRAYSLTFRFCVEGEECWLQHLASGGRVLLAAWHQQFFSAIRGFKAYAKLKPCLMISRSADGELIAGVAQRTGWHPVRGSSSSGGKAALDNMIQQVRKTGLGAHAVDGPKGPAGRVKPGLIRLAQATDAVIVPFYVTVDRCWYIDSWDRFMIPKPFAHVTLRFADPIELETTSERATLENQRQEVEALMRQGWIQPPPAAGPTE